MRGRADAGKEAKKGGEVDPAECKCLIRAIGNKKKISAMISAKDHVKFMQSYGNILKISLDSLKKREKKNKQENDDLTSDYKKLTRQFKDLQEKYHHFQEADEKKYKEVSR